MHKLTTKPAAHGARYNCPSLPHPLPHTHTPVRIPSLFINRNTRNCTVFNADISELGIGKAKQNTYPFPKKQDVRWMSTTSKMRTTMACTMLTIVRTGKMRADGISSAKPEELSFITERLRTCIDTSTKQIPLFGGILISLFPAIHIPFELNLGLIH